MIPRRVPGDARPYVIGEPLILQLVSWARSAPCPACDNILGGLPVVYVLVGIPADANRDATESVTGGTVLVHAECAGIKMTGSIEQGPH